MRLLPSITLLGLASLSTSFAQAPTVAPAPAEQSAATVGFMHAIPATRDVATTLAFYTEVFGIAGEVRAFEKIQEAVKKNLAEIEEPADQPAH